MAMAYARMYCTPKFKYTNMNHKLTFIKSVVLCVMMALCLHMHATTYTATQSGAWSTASTWSGGVAPIANVTTNDIIIINNNVTVTLDQEQTLNQAQLILTVYGTLSGTHSLTVSNGTLNGSGTIDLHNLTLGASSTSLFTGSVVVDNFYNYQSLLSLQSDLTVHDTLGLYGGVLTIAAGSTVSLDADAVLHLDGGSYTNHGNWNQAGNINLLYTGSGTVTTGEEANLSNIHNIWINLTSTGDKVNLGQDLTYYGRLSLLNGGLGLNGNNLTINGTISAYGNGWLVGDTNSIVNINGSGTADSIRLRPGDMAIGDLNINLTNGGSVVLMSDLASYGGLHLQAGTLMIGANHLNLRGPVTGTGMLSANSSSSLAVTGAGSMGTVWWDSTGSTIGTLTLTATGANGMLTIGNDMNVSGNLQLNAGKLDVRGTHLTLSGTSATSAAAGIWADTTTDLTIAGSLLTGMGMMRFDTAGNMVRDLELNTTNQSWISLASDVKVYGKLRLTHGNLNLIGMSSLHLMGTDSIAGGSDSSYVMTAGSGMVWVNLSDSSGMRRAGTLHIGSQSFYAPVRITNNAGANGGFGASAHTGIYANGNSGADISATNYGVNTSWNITTNMGSNANASIQVYWSQDMETSQFDRNNVYLSHYANGTWDTLSSMAAVSASAGMWSATRTGVTSFSPFAVFSSGPNGVRDVSATATLAAYPNPAASVLTVTIPDAARTGTLIVHDVLGHQVATYTVSQTTSRIDVSRLTPGVYYVSLDDRYTQKFVKQ